MAYFTLVSREAATDDWAIEFGDYDREAVQFELDDLHEGYRAIPKRNLKIIRTPDARQSTINAAVDALNGR